MSSRIFVVEDQRSSFELISEIIKLAGGFSVVGHCTTEGMAVQWLHEHPKGAELVILDLVLKEGSGFSVLAHLARGRNPPKVVVLSDAWLPAPPPPFRRRDTASCGPSWSTSTTAELCLDRPPNNNPHLGRWLPMPPQTCASDELD